MRSKTIYMKAENILKSDVLDIIFQNKNKDYGAYQLRKYYPNRLKKSILTTALLVLIFAGLQSWKTPKKVCVLQIGPEISIADFKPLIDKPKEIEKTKPAFKKPMAAIENVIPIIVKDPEKPTPTVDRIDTSFIGNKNIEGPASAGIVGEIPGDKKTPGIGDSKGKIDDGKNVDDNGNEPITNPSIYPEFPGGANALRNFMLHNLHQPDDIEEGQKIVVIAKFVVDKNGNISDIEIVQNGRGDLDDEVKRVIHQMPAWKPGLQNGNPVAVYFKMPITFINNN